MSYTPYANSYYYPTPEAEGGEAALTQSLTPAMLGLPNIYHQNHLNAQMTAFEAHKQLAADRQTSREASMIAQEIPELQNRARQMAPPNYNYNNNQMYQQGGHQMQQGYQGQVYYSPAQSQQAPMQFEPELPPTNVEALVQSSYMHTSGLPPAYSTQYTLRRPAQMKPEIASETMVAPAPVVEKPAEIAGSFTRAVGRPNVQYETGYSKVAHLAPVYAPREAQSPNYSAGIKQSHAAQLTKPATYAWAQPDDGSGYAWEKDDQNLFTRDYNTLDYIPGFSPPADAAAATDNDLHNDSEDTLPLPPQVQTVEQSIAPTTFAHYRNPNRDERILQESDYVGFKSDTVPAYNRPSVPYSYGIQARLTPSPATYINTIASVEPPAGVSTAQSATTANVSECMTAAEPSPHSRFHGSIHKIQDNYEAPNHGRASRDIDYHHKAMIGSAFRAVPPPANSEYHIGHLNDLVSCIDIKH